jgi:hypothetical protein
MIINNLSYLPKAVTAIDKFIGSPLEKKQQLQVKLQLGP